MPLLCLCLLPTPTMAVSTIRASEDTGRLPTLLRTCIETILPQVCDSAIKPLGYELGPGQPGEMNKQLGKGVAKDGTLFI